MKFAVFFQETGEEGILHLQPGETQAQLLERAPEEWRFRHWEEDYATQRQKQRERLLAKHGRDEDYDVDEHMEYLDEMQERYDEQWR